MLPLTALAMGFCIAKIPGSEFVWKRMRNMNIDVRQMLYAVMLFCAASGAANGDTPPPGVVELSHIPRYFVGEHSDLLPKRDIDTNPTEPISLTCFSSGKCVLKYGYPYSYDHFWGFNDLAFANKALDFARLHYQNARSAWDATHLMPLLQSQAKIDQCIIIRDGPEWLGQGSPLSLVCKLDHDPWHKHTVLLMPFDLEKNDCADMFCDLDILPLFREKSSSNDKVE